MQTARRPPARELFIGLSLSAASALCYAFMPLMAKAAYLRGATPLELLSLRFTFAAPLFWAASLSLRRSDLAVGWGNGFLFMLSGIFFGGASICMFYAYHWIDAWLAVILLYTYPPLVGLWSRIFHGERLGPHRIFALLASFAGVVLAAGSWERPGGAARPAGIALALLAGLMYSFYSLYAQRLMAHTGPLVYTSYSATATFLMMAAITPPVGLLRRAGTEVLILAAGMAVISTFAAIYTFARSIVHVGATRASIVSNLEPVAVVVLSWIFLGERFSLLQAAGGSLILGGVYLLQLEHRAHAEGVLTGDQIVIDIAGEKPDNSNVPGARGGA